MKCSFTPLHAGQLNTDPALLCSASIATLPASLYLWVQAAGKEQEFQDLLSQTESAKLEGGALDTACTALQDLVSGVALKDKVLEQACRHPLLGLCAFHLDNVNWCVTGIE